MGCVMSTAIAVLLCKHKCSVERLASTMAFHPPTPPSYTLETSPDGTLGLRYGNPEMAAALRHVSGRSIGVTCEISLLRTKRKQSIPLFHFKCAASGGRTLLWSHANAMDVGEMYFFFIELATRLRVDIFAYDYSGYGAATGEPTESNAYADALAAYDEVAARGVDCARELVLYGQSIGSAPTLYLATKRKCAGVVLHSPLLSGLKFLIPPSTGFCSVGGCCSPTCVYGLCDPFPNIKRIRRVTSPVLLIHGTADRTVDCSHSLTLYQKIPTQHRREPYIIDGAGHENVVDFDVEAYFGRVSFFLRSLDASSAPNASSTTALPAGRPSRGAVSSAPPTRESPLPPATVGAEGIDFTSVRAQCGMSGPGHAPYDSVLTNGPDGE